MHAFLITGSTETVRTDDIATRLRALNISQFDITAVSPDPDAEHISITAIREFKSRLVMTPNNSPYTAGVVRRAHLLTVEAQNALLKLLEEPPPHVLLYIETEVADSLLPTIRSRCQRIVLMPAADTPPSDVHTDELVSLLTQSPGTVIEHINRIAVDRASAKNWTQETQRSAHVLLLKSLSGEYHTVPLRRIIRVVRSLDAAFAELSVNVNPKLCLHAAFLSL